MAHAMLLAAFAAASAHVQRAELALAAAPLTERTAERLDALSRLRAVFVRDIHDLAAMEVTR